MSHQSDPPATEPRIHSTPMAAVKERERELVIVEGTTFKLDRPGGHDLLFDHPAVRAAYAADSYIPYWSELWPAARMLAKAILREPWDEYPKPSDGKLEALEVGCGLGLAGIAALKRGLRVTFSDIDQLAVRFATENARLNGFRDFTTMAIDLRCPPPDVRFPVIIGSDLLYEPRMVDPVVNFISTTLAPGGVCLIADPDRESARPFRWAIQNAGLTTECAFARAGEPGGERTKGTVYRITHCTT